jgi:hypothetical protein
MCCPICLEQIADNGIIILKCNHKFHIECYLQYTLHKFQDCVYDKIEIQCPICRDKEEKIIDLLIKYFKPIIDINEKFIENVDELKNLLIKQFLPYYKSTFDGYFHYDNVKDFSRVLERTTKSFFDDILMFMDIFDDCKFEEEEEEEESDEEIEEEIEEI